MKIEEALRISEEVSRENGKAEKKLRAKMHWEEMSRTAVIMNWGDPREWDD